MSLIEIRISGGAPAARVNAGQAVCAVLAGLITFPAGATGWDGDEWVIRCEAADVDAVSALVGGVALEGFTITVGGHVPPAPVAEPTLLAEPVAAPAAPAKPAKRANRRATPG